MLSQKICFTCLVLVTCISLTSVQAQHVLVEAESFVEYGGWKLDTQFIDEMGSPYLLAHGLGTPVADATTTVKFEDVGTYRVLVRTKDWVARWKAQGQPGKFQILINGKPLKETFGTKGTQWSWQDGGTVEIKNKENQLKIHDLTGFDGRCDAIVFTKDPNFVPPETSETLPAWRRNLLRISGKPIEKTNYDLVVVGGGYAGMGAAVSAARMGCRVALIQNRGVLGGNGSSEVRVWAKGEIRRGRFPRIGEIINEFADSATKSPGTFDEFGDAHKESVVRAEKNIDLFLHHHAYRVDMKADNLIDSVYAFDTRTSELKRFSGKNFVDCTGHGTVGFLAGAKSDTTPKGRMGMSNMWRWDEDDHPVSFPDTIWALELEMKDFPYPRDHHGQWFWESGFDKDPLADAEGIRDWNLRAVFGAFNAMKNRDGADQHENAYLSWVAFVGGPRESRRLLGDVVLTEADIVAKRDFVDGTVPSTWSIDLHYPKEQYMKKYPDNPFISKAVHGKGVDRNYGYPVPYRCFYSRNVDNLMMAGRCISVTHEALGTVRVMKTCGMMGEVVGKAAAICTAHDCTPRAVYAQHLAELKELLHLPGASRRETVNSELTIPDVPMAKPPKPKAGKKTGIAPHSLAGIVIDDTQAIKTGDWRSGTGLNGFIGQHYVYASPDSKPTIQFSFQPPESGIYEVRFAYRHHENRTKKAMITVVSNSDSKIQNFDLTTAPKLENGFVSLGKFRFDKGQTGMITITHGDSQGNLCADAVQLIPDD